MSHEINRLNEKTLADIKQRVERVKTHLQASTAAWLSIAAEFVSAKAQLNNNLAFARFFNDAGFTKPVADKLLKIGNTRLLYLADTQQYLTSVDGWTVLYELAKLDLIKFNTVIALLANDPQKRLTRELVINVANNRKHDEKYVVLACIEVASSKLKQLTMVQAAAIEKRIAEIESILGSESRLINFKKNNGAFVKMRDFGQANSHATSVSFGQAA